MKKVLIATLIFVFGNISLAMEKSPANLIYYKTAKMNIDLLQKKADNGDFESALAVYDFYESVKDPEYSISYPSSIELLKKLSLLDSDDKVHKATREAFKEYGNLE